MVERAALAEGNQERLQKVFKKAESGERIVLGVIGGSITEGAACSKPDKRYHGVMLSWWRKSFPKSECVLVNAGIGATASNYGAMRLERDLLSKKPDLVVLEYAVNDRSAKEFAESYEGMVRQILNSPSKPALVLLFMARRKASDSAQEWQAKIGSHYNLPMVSYRDALLPEIDAQKLKWEQFSADSVHPNERGHTLAGQLLCAFLQKALSAYASGKTVAQKEPALPAPLISSRFESCRLLDGEDMKLAANQGWAYDGSSKRSAGWKSCAPGSTMEMETEGECIFISYWRIKGPMGMVSVSVDGGNPVKFDSFFEETWGGYRHMEQVAAGLAPGKHKVKIELLQERNPKSSGNEFRVLCIGSAGAKGT